MKLGEFLVAFLSLFVGELGRASLPIETPLGRQVYQVEIADGALSQMRGLMYRDGLIENAGMLFVYPKERNVQFWMKNVSFPLDMLFLDRCGIVLSIHKNAPAFDETIIRPDHKVRMVLELRGEASKRAQIRQGMKFDLENLMGLAQTEWSGINPLQVQSAERPLPCLN